MDHLLFYQKTHHHYHLDQQKIRLDLNQLLIQLLKDLVIIYPNILRYQVLLLMYFDDMILQHKQYCYILQSHLEYNLHFLPMHLTNLYCLLINPIVLGLLVEYCLNVLVLQHKFVHQMKLFHPA